MRCPKKWRWLSPARLAGVFAVCTGLAARADESVYSAHWGESGERWRAGGALEDFSRAGYRMGEAAIPEWPAGVNVRDFGAVGDGVADCTEAFRKAVEHCPAQRAVWIPNGTYVIRDWIRIPAGRGGVVFRGEEMRKAVLLFPKGLQEIHPQTARTTHNSITTAWSWGGGFLWFEGGEDRGVENLTFRFPNVPYAGHFEELGYNALTFSGKARHCWGRNLVFINADSGPYCNPADYVTLRHLIFEAEPGRAHKDGMTGHHGVTVKQGTGCLIEDFDFRTTLWHECCLEHGAHHNVWSNGRGVALHLDHHQATPHHNLWTQIHVGDPWAVWKNNCKGSTEGDVYWNVRGDKPIPYPTNKACKNNLFVGLQGSGAPTPGQSNTVEALDPMRLAPPNLYEAQRAGRATPGAKPPAAAPVSSRATHIGSLPVVSKFD